MYPNESLVECSEDVLRFNLASWVTGVTIVDVALVTGVEMVGGWGMPTSIDVSGRGGSWEGEGTGAAF